MPRRARVHARARVRSRARRGGSRRPRRRRRAHARRAAGHRPADLAPRGARPGPARPRRLRRRAPFLPRQPPRVSRRRSSSAAKTGNGGAAPIRRVVRRSSLRSLRSLRRLSGPPGVLLRVPLASARTRLSSRERERSRERRVRFLPRRIGTTLRGRRSSRGTVRRSERRPPRAFLRPGTAGSHHRLEESPLRRVGSLALVPPRRVRSGYDASEFPLPPPVAAAEALLVRGGPEAQRG